MPEEGKTGALGGRRVEGRQPQLTTMSGAVAGRTSERERDLLTRITVSGAEKDANLHSFSPLFSPSSLSR
jgi:hypothetical protein